MDQRRFENENPSLEEDNEEDRAQDRALGAWDEDEGLGVDGVIEVPVATQTLIRNLTRLQIASDFESTDGKPSHEKALRGQQSLSAHKSRRSSKPKADATSSRVLKKNIGTSNANLTDSQVASLQQKLTGAHRQRLAMNAAQAPGAHKQTSIQASSSSRISLKLGPAETVMNQRKLLFSKGQDNGSIGNRYTSMQKPSISIENNNNAGTVSKNYNEKNTDDQASYDDNDDDDDDDDEDDDNDNDNDDDDDGDDDDDAEDEDMDDEEYDDEDEDMNSILGDQSERSLARDQSGTTRSRSENADTDPFYPMQALISPFGLPPTIWFDYPEWMSMNRAKDAEHVLVQPVPESARTGEPDAFRWRSYWERNCLKDVFVRAGMTGGRGEKRRARVVWTKHAKKWKAFRPSQRHNHFAGSWTIGRKDRLAFTIGRKRRENNGTDAFNFLPETFILPLHSARLRQVLSAPQAKRQTWIRKPLASSQGRGIRVLSHQAAVDVVKSVSKSKKATHQKASRSRGCIVQRYIDNPLLINRFKFDIRVYVLVTGYDPLRVYMFPEGLVRFCTQPYSTSISSKKNNFRHLTNYSINKKSERFEPNQDAEDDAVGSKWSLTAWYRYMEATYGKDILGRIRRDMESVIVKTCIAADDDVNQKMASMVPNADCCFELFGFDLMIDRDFRTWLVEVNISPSLMTASPLDRKVKTMMICDLLHLVGIPAPNADSFESSSEAASLKSGQQQASKVRRNSKTTSVETKKVREPRNILGLGAKPWAALPQADRKLVQKVAGERLRRGNFERLYPPLNDQGLHESYMKLFTSRRYNNVLIQRFERAALKELSSAVKLQATGGVAQGSGFRHVRNQISSAKIYNKTTTQVPHSTTLSIASSS